MAFDKNTITPQELCARLRDMDSPLTSFAAEVIETLNAALLERNGQMEQVMALADRQKALIESQVEKMAETTGQLKLLQQQVNRSGGGIRVPTDEEAAEVLKAYGRHDEAAALLGKKR